jgi:flavin-dependent dehydrogenase
MGIKDLEDLLKDYLQLFLIDYPATGYVLNSGKIYQFKSLYDYVKNKIGGVIPVPPPLERVVYGKVALIGDAGNIINSAVGRRQLRDLSERLQKKALPISDALV